MIDGAKLMAYADGELSPEDRAEIEHAVAADPALRAQLEAHQRLRAELSQAYASVTDEAVPQRLLTAAQRPAPPAAEVVDLGARRVALAKWSVREWGAMAASLAGGLLVGFSAMNVQSPLIAVNKDGMNARGGLARALDDQLASDAAGAVRIGLTFRNHNGAYCRTFELTERDTAGIACRDGGDWDVAMTTAQPAQGEVRTAGASGAILAAADQMIEGEALNAEAEAAARDAGWGRDGAE